MSTYNVDVTQGLANAQGLQLPFGTVAGNVMSQAVVTAFDIYPPDTLPQLFERHGRYVSFRSIIAALGFAKGTSTPTTGHYETSHPINNLRIGSIITASGGAGENMVVALDADDMFTTTIAGTAVTGSYPDVKEIIHFSPGVNAHIIAKNTSVSPHQLTLRPGKASVNLDDIVAEGARYFIASNAYPEGDGFAKGKTPRVFKYSNDFQEVKTGIGTTGKNLADKVVFEPVPGRQGSYFLRMENDFYERFEIDCDSALIFGAKSDNIQMTSLGLDYEVPVKTTEGLVDFAWSYGHRKEYTPTFKTMKDFDEIAAIMEAERIGTNDIYVGQGFKAFQNDENLLKDYVGDSDNFMQGLGVSVGFNFVKKSNFRFMFHKIDPFSHPKLAGTPGYDYPGWSIYMPMRMSTDVLTGSRSGSIGYEYKELDGYNRHQRFAVLDGTGSHLNPNNIEADILRKNLSSEIAFHGTCPNQIVIEYPGQ